MKKLSCVCLAKDEEEFLPLAVASVIDGCDEVILVDNQSTDSTPLVMQHLAKVYPTKIKLHSHDTDFDHSCEFNQRNIVINYPVNDWILVLDADQVLSDGWRSHVEPLLARKGCEGIRLGFEHLVGSYEYIHISFYDKQHGLLDDPNIPLSIASIFKRTGNLHCRAAADTCPQFRPQHHARFDESVPPARMFDCPQATVFHYGFAKRKGMYMAEYRIHRGDYGHEPELKRRMIEELRASGNPYHFIGSVHRVDYGPEFVPSVMRAAFGTTYRLELDANGFIKQRYCMKTGEPC